MPHNDESNFTRKRSYKDRLGNDLNINDIVDYADPETNTVKSYIVDRIDKMTITLRRKGEKKILKDIDSDLYHKEGTAIQDPDLLANLFKSDVDYSNNSNNIPNKLAYYTIKMTLRDGTKINQEIIAISEDEALDNAMPMSFEIE